MNPMYGVIAWVVSGCFVAWIATNVMALRGRGRWIGNLAVGVLGALIGGYFTRMPHAGSSYDAFSVSVLGAFVGATVLIALASLPPVRVWRDRHAL
jgi:uncharacterized membrane protein YeaQ/YmgE (transglycosylase-associated protein family)